MFLPQWVSHLLVLVHKCFGMPIMTPIFAVPTHGTLYPIFKIKFLSNIHLIIAY